METIIRIYDGDTVRELSTAEKARIRIGNTGKDLDHCYAARRGEAKILLDFNCTPQGWVVKCTGPVFLSGECVKRQELAAGQIFLIDKAGRRAVEIVQSRAADAVEVPLSEDDTLLIGRSENCGLQIRDPRVSGGHAKLYMQNGALRLCDINSTNGTFLNGHRIEDEPVQNGDVIQIGDCRLQYTGGKLLLVAGAEKASLHLLPKVKGRGRDFSPLFQRSPRLLENLGETELEIEPAPQIGQKPEINWLTVLLPPLLMAAVMTASALFLSGSAAMLSGVMMLVSVLTSVLNYQSQKKKYHSMVLLRREKYRDYLASRREEIHALNTQRLDALHRVHPDVRRCMQMALTKNRQLWERRPQDADFLSLRVGTGTAASPVRIKTPRLGVLLQEDEFTRMPEKLKQELAQLEGAPVLCALAEHGSCGVIGDAQAAARIVQNMLVSAAALHCYDELKLITICSEQQLSAWEWLKWLPHSFSESREERYLASNRTQLKRLSLLLDDTLRARTQDAREAVRNNRTPLPFLLFVVTDPQLIEGSTIGGMLAHAGRATGTACIFLAPDIGWLPPSTRILIEAQPDSAAAIYLRDDAARRQMFRAEAADAELYERFARALAPLQVPEKSAQSLLPACVSFLEGYGVKRPEDLAAAQRWANARCHRSLAVPIGIRANGEPFYFDIHEKAHGPHGIVAGMTGSGKSEMVQSWILSMCLQFPPEDVSFVLIDFKGTGLILPFLQLPHLAGTISDLDKNIGRNLIALESEIERRKALLDQAGVNNCISYKALYSQGKASEPLPFLFIVIDEYAEFKANFPSFTAAIDSIFRTGRTLGIYILLLTQKPAGVVNEEMQANSRFRWCLKVASAADSREMLKHPDAVKITNPGRAYIQVGDDEVYEPVQSFWSGAPYEADRKKPAASAPRVSVVGLTGSRDLYTPERNMTVGPGVRPKEIDRIVRMLADTAQAIPGCAARQIWRPRLAPLLELRSILPAEPSPLSVCVGLVDNPAEQSQYPLCLHLERDGHIVLAGAAGSGKTTFLQTAMMSVCETKTPQEAVIYAMDFGSWSLRAFERFPQVGAVASGVEAEKIERIARLLGAELLERKKNFAALGVGNIAAYNETAPCKKPHILLVIDNFQPVLAQYPHLEEFFLSIASDGASLGICYLVSCPNLRALGYRMTQYFKTRLTLQTVDRSEYAEVIGKTDGLEPEALPGRGLCRQERTLEFQTALPVPGATEAARAAEIARLAVLAEETWHGESAPKIVTMPEQIEPDTLPADKIALGLSYDTVSPVTLDFAGQAHCCVISGTLDADKTGLLAALTAQFIEKYAAEAYVCCGAQAAARFPAAAQMLASVGEFDSLLESLVPELEQRAAGAQKQDWPAILIAIDDFRHCFEEMSQSSARRLQAIVRRGGGLRVFVLAAAGSDELARLVSQGEPISELLAKMPAVLLGGSYREHGAFRSAKQPDSTELLEKGDGYLNEAASVTRFKCLKLL